MLHTELIAPIPELLARHAKSRGGKTAYWDSSRAITYGDLDRRTAAIAANLAAMGVSSGDRIAIYLPNGVDWVETCFAGLRCGAVLVPIPYDAAEGEISYRLIDADCRVAITTAERQGVLEKLRQDAHGRLSIIVTRGGTGGPTLETLAAQAASGPRDPDDIDVSSFIIYTSGTTGRAKGVLLSVRGMLWIAASCWGPIFQMSEQDVLLSPLPLFHSYALNLAVLAVLATGASEHIMEKFSPQTTIELLRTGKYTIFPGVPTMFHYILQRAQEQGIDRLGRTRLFFSAGAIMPAALNKAFEERFGTVLLDGYGITETSTMVATNWMTGSRPFGSCGLPLPGLAVRIVSPATGEDVAFGDEGELIVRGPNLMQGYHNKEAETAAALRKGWYHTGDLARSDPNGYLTITGRIKELIIRGGQNIAPAEIEEVVALHEQVLECAVVGMPHEALGEVPHLFVVARSSDLDRNALLAHCRRSLSGYKIPEAIHLVSEIPRTGSGKIMRYKLVEALNRR